jgi:aarF domain-containing kinase
LEIYACLSLGWIKYLFPEFEFTWLGEEMRENLPKEMDFVHEASNAARARNDFKDLRTSLHIPEVISASKRVLIMEYIQGGRVDDLAYLAEHNIDRNKVALELTRIFSQMVFVNGWFHAVSNLPSETRSSTELDFRTHILVDHLAVINIKYHSDVWLGNLLIRSAPPNSGSPYNFEIALLDHGLYFDLDPYLRINYCKLWLSLIAPASASTDADRRKYAELVGNIGPDLVGNASASPVS